MMQMISRPTSAMATTSVRRMTGGNSPLLSGTGVPSRSSGKLSFAAAKVFVGGDVAAKGLLAGEGLVGMTLTMVFPRPKRR